MNKNTYFNVFKHLIHADLLMYKDFFITKCIDVGIWVVLTILVTAYIMPYFGLQADFGAFQLGGVIAAVGLFELYGSVVDLVSDLEGNRVINYNLTLPIPTWVALLSKVAYYSIIYTALALVMLPIGKLTLWNQLNLWNINYVKLLVALVSSSIFYGCFTLWAGSMVNNMGNIGTVWARYIFPMWFMGGFQFSWKSLVSTMPFVAYVSLLNPMIYVTESTRVAMLGQEQFLNFWLCIIAILFLSILCLTWALRILKRRLDFV